MPTRCMCIGLGFFGGLLVNTAASFGGSRSAVTCFGT